MGNHESGGGRQGTEFNILAQESRGKVMEGPTLAWKRKYKKENNLMESGLGCSWSLITRLTGANHVAEQAR